MLVLIVEIWAKFEPKIAKNYQTVPKKRLKIDLVKSSRQKSTWSQSWEIDLTRLNSTDSEHYSQPHKFSFTKSLGWPNVPKV